MGRKKKVEVEETIVVETSQDEMNDNIVDSKYIIHVPKSMRVNNKLCELFMSAVYGTLVDINRESNTCNYQVKRILDNDDVQKSFIDIFRGITMCLNSFFNKDSVIDINKLHNTYQMFTFKHNLERLKDFAKKHFDYDISEIVFIYRDIECSSEVSELDMSIMTDYIFPIIKDYKIQP